MRWIHDRYSLTIFRVYALRSTAAVIASSGQKCLDHTWPHMCARMIGMLNKRGVHRKNKTHKKRLGLIHTSQLTKTQQLAQRTRLLAISVSNLLEYKHSFQQRVLRLKPPPTRSGSISENGHRCIAAHVTHCYYTTVWRLKCIPSSSCRGSRSGSTATAGVRSRWLLAHARLSRLTRCTHAHADARKHHHRTIAATTNPNMFTRFYQWGEMRHACAALIAAANRCAYATHRLVGSFGRKNELHTAYAHSSCACASAYAYASSSAA